MVCLFVDVVAFIFPGGGGILNSLVTSRKSNTFHFSKKKIGKLWHIPSGVYNWVVNNCIHVVFFVKGFSAPSSFFFFFLFFLAIFILFYSYLIELPPPPPSFFCYNTSRNRGGKLLNIFSLIIHKKRLTWYVSFKTRPT